MFLYLKIWFFRKFFGRTAFEVITKPISAMAYALEKLMDAKVEEMMVLEVMHKAASDEHDLAEATLKNLQGVLG